MPISNVYSRTSQRAESDVDILLSKVADRLTTVNGQEGCRGEGGCADFGMLVTSRLAFIT